MTEFADVEGIRLFVFVLKVSLEGIVAGERPSTVGALLGFVDAAGSWWGHAHCSSSWKKGTTWWSAGWSQACARRASGGRSYTQQGKRVGGWYKGNESRLFGLKGEKWLETEHFFRID